MMRGLRWPILGVMLAIAITSTMDARGLFNFSALPLAPLLCLLSYLQRLPAGTVGFRWGERRCYLPAVLYPLGAATVLIAAAGMAGAMDLSHVDWKKTALRLVLLALATALGAIITEEGFFRGWLWASLERAGLPFGQIVIWTSIAFSLWHWSAVMLNTGFEPPRSQVPVYMINVAVLGAIWGLLRWHSGSVIVTSVSHGVWNAMAYVLFGFGSKAGVLGIRDTGIYGPEVGVYGLALNLAFLAALWLWYRRLANQTAGET